MSALNWLLDCRKLCLTFCTFSSAALIACLSSSMLLWSFLFSVLYATTSATSSPHCVRRKHEHI